MWGSQTQPLHLSALQTSAPLSIESFWQHPVSRSFHRALSTNSGITRLLLTVSQARKRGDINEETKGQLKEQILRGVINTERDLAQLLPSGATGQPQSTLFAPFQTTSMTAIHQQQQLMQQLQLQLQNQHLQQPFLPQPAAKALQPKRTAAAAAGRKWESAETLLVFQGDDAIVPPSGLVAAFDMDDTLITRKSGRAFAVDRYDWQWWHPSVPQKLRELHDEGYKLVIFTNQAGVAKGKTSVDDIRGKIADLTEQLGLPVQAFVATEEDKWRKPSTAMWDLFVERHNGGVVVDRTRSFYCGDAAGRPAAWDGQHDTKKDHSCSDRKFAHNIGLQFRTPEMCFLGQPDAREFDWGSVDPATITRQAGGQSAYEGSLTSTAAQEMIICVGFPGSGKSTFTKRNLVPQGYVHINQDTLGTKAACLTSTAAALAKGCNVVIDNTNPSAATRAQYIDLAKARGIPVRCFVFRTSFELAQHLNLYREKVFGVRHIPAVGYHMYRKQFQEPSISEGFSEIKDINFVPQFDGAENEKLFHHFT